jgi:tripartite motif-containing protein 71
VADALVPSVFVYPRLAMLPGQTNYPNVTPLATIYGSNTGLSYPEGIALDSSNDIYVADNNANSVFVYSAGSTGNVAPIATISTSMTTGLEWPQGIALDSSGKIYVADAGDTEASPPIPASVFVYPAGSNANTAPTATISGLNTGLIQPEGIALDSSRNIYVADWGGPSVFVYSAGSSGNVFPIATISGSGTDLDSPEGIALDHSGNIYVADDGDNSCDGTESVYVYPAGSTGNVTPSAIIAGSNTGLCYPYGIGLDSSGNIYVADQSGSVFVYPPLASLPSQPGYPNVTPLAIIYGSNTGLSYPVGIALDSSNDIYVADQSGSVFVYPPLGSSTGPLNVAPTATISGPLTELGVPQFIALQPAALPKPTATATSTATATPTATPTGTPGILVSPKSLSLTAPHGTSTTGTVTIKDTGTGELIGSVSGSGGAFSITGGSGAYSLAPGAMATVTVKFAAPAKKGKSKSSFTITDNVGKKHKPVNVGLTGKST